ncbi:MAG: hypothetical protein AAF798_12675 [Bacteroidota bacterium]
MEIVEIIRDSLYSVRYDSATSGSSEFEYVMDQFTDPIFLEEFFEEHQSDLNSGFWGSITIEEAILKTRKEAIQLERKLLQIAESGKTDRYETLSTLFKPLRNNPIKIERFEKNKAKGNTAKSWIRIYAIRIDTNFFVITGGSIKLTPTMNERTHLLNELDKLENVRKFLLNEDNYDDSYFFELI